MPHTTARVSRRPAQSGFVQSPIMRFAAARLSFDASALLLDRRAGHRAIAAKHTAIPALRPQRLRTPLAGIEPHARVCRHCLRRLVAAVWARDRRAKLQGDACLFHGPNRQVTCGAAQSGGGSAPSRNARSAMRLRQTRWQCPGQRACAVRLAGEVQSPSRGQ